MNYLAQMLVFSGYKVGRIKCIYVVRTKVSGPNKLEHEFTGLTPETPHPIFCYATVKIS